MMINQQFVLIPRMRIEIETSRGVTSPNKILCPYPYVARGNVVPLIVAAICINDINHIATTERNNSSAIQR